MEQSNKALSEEIFDLEAAIKSLCGEFQEIERVYIFGSRRFNTTSTRSDIDILLDCGAPIKKSKLRDFIIRYRTALDLFVLEEGRAESVANESFITSKTKSSLITELNAVEIYARGVGSSDFLLKHKNLVIDRRAAFALTVLPSRSAEYYEVAALQKFFRTAQEHGLPARPYIGISTSEAGEFVISVIRAMPSANNSVTNSGLARKGWTLKPVSEYDFQNLFWITVKPWLPGLSREEVAITYDGKEKRADFNLFGNQLIVELKYIKDDGDVRETSKTLAGLADFYQAHANVRMIIFAILVEKSVALDDLKWENDYTYDKNVPIVRTVIVRNNS